MKKNEINNFFRQYKHTVCLDGSLEPIKIVDVMGDTFLIENSQREKVEVSADSHIIPLKGRLKDKDYNYLEALFHKDK